MSANVMGDTRFALERVRLARMSLILHTPCLVCGQPIAVSDGHQAVFRIDTDILGVCCENCLDPQTRAALARRRQLSGEHDSCLCTVVNDAPSAPVSGGDQT